MLSTAVQLPLPPMAVRTLLIMTMIMMMGMIMEMAGKVMTWAYPCVWSSIGKCSVSVRLRG